jgi:hypothetical protein
VPLTGGEKESLHISLDRHRDAVMWKMEGLGDAEYARLVAARTIGPFEHCRSGAFTCCAP